MLYKYSGPHLELSIPKQQLAALLFDLSSIVSHPLHVQCNTVCEVTTQLTNLTCLLQAEGLVGRCHNVNVDRGRREHLACRGTGLA